MSLIPEVYRGGAPEPAPLIGRELAGCRVERLLGRGGMGEVFLARRLQDGAAVVIKRLAPELADQPLLRARFLREGDALRRLPPHPGVVRVLGALESDVGPLLFLEHVPGETLFARLRRAGPLPWDAAARLGAAAARALHAVHAAGLLHRDVNPNNLMLTPEGAPKLIDFGLVKDALRTTLTSPGQLLGTAFYLAPEQVEGGAALDARCDVWALGATLYHLLCGRPPFVGAELADVLEAIREGELTPPRALVPAAAPALEEALLQALEVEPRHRYGTALALALDLERALRGGPVSAPAFVLPDGAVRSLVGRPRATLGADPRCDLPVPGAAPRHAQVRRTPRGFLLGDLEGSSGTWVDGAPVTHEPRLLRHGADVRLGPVALRFHDPRPLDRAAAANAPPPPP